MTGRKTLDFHASQAPMPNAVKKSIIKERRTLKSTPNVLGLVQKARSKSTSKINRQKSQADVGSTVPREDQYQTTRKTIPGNANVSMLQSVATAATAVLDQVRGHPHHHLMDDETGHPSILKLQAMSPSALQMETMRQQHQLNRMASLRHSMAVKMQTEVGGGAYVKAHNPHSLLPPVDNEFNQMDDIDAPVAIPQQSGPSTFANRKKFQFLTSAAMKTQIKIKEQVKAVQEDWEKLTTVRANDLHNVVKYRSKSTGLQVVHAQLEAPTVHGYFAFSHQCKNDWGLPHILQHMIFLGSKKFPYPGLLDRMASKCFASSTDAWTDSDHSCYTITTAGKQGFLSLLPIYMDHLFFPTLGEAGYMTEVHHINSEGKDGGVCYMEMQSIQHEEEEQGNWALHREIYDETSGYYFNYGGDCKEMRAYCSLKAVRDFHKEFYHPQNCCIVICGDLQKEDIFAAINPFMRVLMDTKIMPDESWINPWREERPVTIFEEIHSIVNYPSETEGDSLVKVGIVGSLVTKDVTLTVGMDILFQYLVDSPASPVQIVFVESEEHFLASRVHTTKMNHIQTIYCLNFEDVPTDKQEKIVKVLRQVLERQTHEFDAERMESIVSHCYEQAMSAMENYGASTIAHAVIADFLYAEEQNELIFDRRINLAYIIEQFKEQPATFWVHLIQMILEQNWATVYMVPSTEVIEEYRQEELERHQAILEELGENGQKKLAARLKAAVKIQSKHPPPGLLNFILSPRIDSIGFLGIERQANPSWASETLCNLFLDDINSHYVYLTVLMDTSELNLEEKKYLVLFAEALLESPYVDNSQKYYSYEQFISGLSRDVLNYQTSFGIDWDPATGTRFSCGSFSHLFCVRFQMEMRKVKEGFEWMQLLLWNTKWQPDRLKNVAQRLTTEVHHMKNHGATMTKAMITESLFHMNSNAKAMSLIRQQVFLERVANELPRSFQKVAKMLENIRMVILRPENTTVHVATSLPKMEFHLTDQPEVSDAIAQLLRRTFDYTGWHWGYPTKRLAADPDSKWMRSVECIAQCSNEQILRMHSDEGSYLIQVSPCIKDFNDRNYPMILVAIQYFCQKDGPFFKEIKSTGYATSFSMKLKPNEGMLYFEILGATELVAAYVGAFNTILSHLNDDEVWDKGLLESAQSSAIFELIEKEDTPKALALHSLLDYYHQVPPGFSRAIMEKIIKVTLDDVKNVTKQYFQNLFIETTTCAVASPDDKAPGIIQGLMENCGKRLALLPPVHQSEMAAYV